MESTRVAWLLPSAFFYWHPPICHFTKRFPQTKVFTGRWRGFAKGFEDTFSVEVVGDRQVISLRPTSTGYGANFTYVSPKILGHLLKFRPELIFTNSFGVWSMLALMLKPLFGWRVVLAYEGSSPSVDFRESPTRLALRRVLSSGVDAFISNSQAGKDYLIDCLQVDVSKIFVQPYEVPAVEALTASTDSIKTLVQTWTSPIFLYVGQIIPRKGLNLLLDACALLKQRGADRFTLVIVGDGSQRPELETYAQTLNIANLIQWIGRVDYDCLGEYFSVADAFILPTLEDTWGMVVLEAMTLHTAQICSCFAGASELVSEGENGFVVDPQDAEALAKAMERFISDTTLGDRLGQGAANTMAQYSPEAAGQFLASVADRVLSPSLQGQG